MGLPCFFIRTAGCDLRCAWCDTPEALAASSGEWYSLEDILARVPENVELVQITGGEPLLQKEKVIGLCRELTAAPRNKKILLETGGHISLEGIPPDVHIVMDIKLPASGEHNHDFARNFSYLKLSDEIKFVVGNRDDFDKAKDWIVRYNLTDVCQILLSPVYQAVELIDLGTWIIDSGLNVRLQTQLHKLIWGASARSV